MSDQPSRPDWRQIKEDLGNTTDGGRILALMELEDLLLRKQEWHQSQGSKAAARLYKDAAAHAAQAADLAGQALDAYYHKVREEMEAEA